MERRSLTPEGARMSFGKTRKCRAYFGGVLRVDWASFITKPKLIEMGLQTLWPQNSECSRTMQFFTEKAVSAKAEKDLNREAGAKDIEPNERFVQLSRRNEATQKYCSTTANRPLLERLWFLRTFPGLILVILRTQNSISNNKTSTTAGQIFWCRGELWS